MPYHVTGKKKKGIGISVKEPKTAERQEEGQKKPEKQNITHTRIQLNDTGFRYRTLSTSTGGSLFRIPAIASGHRFMARQAGTAHSRLNSVP